MLHHTDNIHKHVSWPQGCLAAAPQRSTDTATAPSQAVSARSVTTNSPGCTHCSAVKRGVLYSNLQHDTQDVFPFLGCQSIAYHWSPWTNLLTQASLWTDCPLYIGQARAGCRSFSYLLLYPLCSVGVLTLAVHLGSQQAPPPFTHAIGLETRPLAAITGLKPQLTQTDLLQISLLHITRPWPSYEKRFWWEATSLLTAI